MGGHTVEEVRKSVRTYVVVFVALAALTVLTVAVSYLDLGAAAAIRWGRPRIRREAETRSIVSLKAFHIFFIAASIVLSIGLASWGVRDYLSSGAGGSLALGIVFFVTGFLLLVYGRRFLKKMKEIRV